MIAGGEDFISNISQKITTNTPIVGVVSGLSSALNQLNETPFTTQILESNANEYKLSNGILTDDPIKVKLVYFLTNATTLKLVWDYEFYSQDTKHLWNLKVDALDGKIIDQQDLVISCSYGSKYDNHCAVLEKENLFTQLFFKENSTSLALNPGTTQYRVIPWNYESPNHSPRQLITNPEYVANASPKGWHDANTLTGTTTALRYNITRGNNVWARNDFAGSNTTLFPNGTSPTGTGTLDTLRPNITIGYSTITTCSGTPDAGTIVSSDTAVCKNTTAVFQE